MTFDEWHDKQLDGDADNCPHKAWERFAWDAAVLAEREACAALCDRYAERWPYFPSSPSREFMRLSASILARGNK